MTKQAVPKKIILDCDPGQDDAISLLLALASPNELDILGITAVAGNLPLSITERNVRMMCDLADRDYIPVHAGCDRPLNREPITAEHIHGDTGVDGMDVFEPKTPLQALHASDFIVDTLLANELDSVTLVPSGPLTNIAHAIQKDAKILAHIRKIVLMGGAMREGGNYSPSAEFNMIVDPEAANIVFECGRPVVAIGLDVTHQVISTPARVERIRALGNNVADAAAGMLQFFDRYDRERYGMNGAPLHDPCTVAYLLRPDLFSMKACNISIETKSELTLGHTAVDFWNLTDKPHNTLWAHAIDADGFYELLVNRLATYGDA